MSRTLNGIAWNHSRAYPPLVAVSQRYEELHPGVRIRWDKRTLDEFGHKPIDQLASDYDFIVIDHPWAGYCFDQNLVLDLRNLLSDEMYNQLDQHTIGPSFSSYLYNDRLLAVPIDAATPAPSWRQDLMDREGLLPPETWNDLIALADKKRVIMPGFGADLFLNWLMLLHALDAQPFEAEEMMADQEQSLEAMAMLKRLAESMPDEIFHWNPIKVAERMTSTDHYSYCAFAYSYGNYSRPSFVNCPLKYGNLVKLNGQPLRSILGGTGMAITTGCQEVSLAVDFAVYCASAYTQSNIYTYAGGQPVRQEAWQNSDLNAFVGGFFADSYDTHQNAILRPRYNGYVAFQEQAGIPLQQYIRGELSIDKAWDEIEKMYRLSRQHEIRNK